MGVAGQRQMHMGVWVPPPSRPPTCVSRLLHTPGWAALAARQCSNVPTEMPHRLRGGGGESDLCQFQLNTSGLHSLLPRVLLLVADPRGPLSEHSQFSSTSAGGGRRRRRQAVLAAAAVAR